MLNNSFLYFILIVVLAEGLALSCLKEYRATDRIIFFFVAIVLYSIVCYGLNESFKEKNSMAVVNIVWSGLSVLFTTLIGVMYYKEKLHHIDYMAILMIAIGLIILRN
jgi:multidrug transporter EmrE-like cation transporter